MLMPTSEETAKFYIPVLLAIYRHIFLLDNPQQTRGEKQLQQ